MIAFLPFKSTNMPDGMLHDILSPEALQKPNKKEIYHHNGNMN